MNNGERKMNIMKKNQNKKFGGFLLSTILSLTLVSAPANATLQQNIAGPGGTTLDNSNAPDGFSATAFQLPDAAIADGLGTIDTANGVLTFEGNPFLFQGPLTNISFDANGTGNALTNIEAVDFATNILQAGQIIAFDNTGAPVLVGPGTAGQILTSNGVSAPSFQANAGGGGGGGSVTSVASADASITVTNGTTTPDLSVAALQPNITTADNLNSIGTAGNTTTVNGSLIVAETLNASGNLAVTGAITGASFTGGISSSNVAITGGSLTGVSIDNSVIGANTPANASFTTLTATTTNAGALTSTSSNTASLTATTADIDGGTIDNTVIGGTNPAAATVTTLDTTGAATVATTLSVAGVNVGAGTGLTSTLLGGNGATASGTNSTALGSAATASGTGSTAVGAGATASNDNSTAIGAGATTTADNQIVLGSDGQNGNPPAPTVVIPGTLIVNGQPITPVGNNVTTNNVTISDTSGNNPPNNINITNNNGELTAMGTNGSVILNQGLLNTDKFTIDPNDAVQANRVHTIAFGADARELKFNNFAPCPLKVNLVNNTVDFGIGAPTPLVDGAAVDITKANLRLTLNQATNSVNVEYINTTGFDSISREFVADIAGVIR